MIYVHNGELLCEICIALDPESALCIQYYLVEVALIKHHWSSERSHGGQELWERGHVHGFCSLAENEVSAF